MSESFTIASMFTDHMVLQQQTPIPVWGRGPEGGRVTVSLPGQMETAVVSGGDWIVRLASMQAGGPYEMTICLDNPAAVGKDTDTFADTDQNAYSNIRLSDIWIGEVWLAGGQSNMVQPLLVVEGGIEAAAKADYPCIRFFTTPRRPYHGAVVPGWDFIGTLSEDADWQVCTPETALHVTGIGYYFAEFLQHAREVPVGIISCCWGATPAQAWMSESWLKRSPRLKPLWDAFTEHTAALDKNEYDREYDRYVEDMYRLIEERGDIAGKVRELGLDGYRRWVSAHPLVWPDQPYSHKSPERPCGLYETMLQTVAPYAIRGVLWYQGEANANRAEAVLYRELLTGLIANWREAWDSPELPFLIVQLSSFAWLGNPDGEIWPVIREAQEAVANDVPHTALIVTIDCGQRDDIHPVDKRTVAERLALAARAKAYGEDASYSGPRYLDMAVEGRKAIIAFDPDSVQPCASSGALSGFTICGDDRRFVPADARFSGNRVEVSSPDVDAPVAVRYAWSNMPAASVKGNNGIPAAPFRTDDFDIQLA